MKKYIYIGIGGFLGALSRYLFKLIPISAFHEYMPLSTLIINLSGSFLIALILTFALEVRDIQPDVRLGITSGFLGAFTTFSTLCKETVGLLQNGNYFSAISYITLSITLGLGLAYLGIVIAREIGIKVKTGKKQKYLGQDPDEE